MKKKIYVAGPYTKGDVEQNVYNAIVLANELKELGFLPFVPHLLHYWHLKFPLSYEFCCELDNEYLLCCDALIRIPGESLGSDAEEKLAMSRGIPVFYTIEDLVEYYQYKWVLGG